MTDELIILCGTAASIGFLHTLLGPDHYLPFIAMGRAGRWSLTKTVTICLLCGLGHVLSSVVVGCLGIALGVGVFKLEAVESYRGDLAGWLLLAFGLTYSAWGIRRAIRHRPHTHWHVHENGIVHAHEHIHVQAHAHVHAGVGTEKAVAALGQEPGAPSLTPWILFTIFIFGPCEPLIPILMYPAAEGSLGGVIVVTAVFGLVTLMTMGTVVALCYAGLGSVRWERWERYGHAVAGGVVTLSGLAIMVGW